jgi:hypothetical protein
MLCCWAESTKAVAAFCFAAPGQTEFYVLREMTEEMNDETYQVPRQLFFLAFTLLLQYFSCTPFGGDLTIFSTGSLTFDIRQ